MKIVTVIGNRPQFIKAALISKKIRILNDEILVHTGQHYDKNLSDIFFSELDLPEPEINLGIAESEHGKQVGLMLIELEKILLQEKPDIIIVYGDTNSTLAGALSASKLHIPIVHIEAGLRSYNKIMPEEINRVLTDHISSLLLCPNQQAINNLEKEGISNGVFNCGDVMEEVFFLTMDSIIKNKGNYIYMTLHRAENTDDELVLFKRLSQIAGLNMPVKWPIHPRTKNIINRYALDIPSNIEIIPPQGYYDNINLLVNADYVITDSGGLQKESFWAGIPCFTMRSETEWGYTVDSGWNTLISIDDDLVKIIKSYSSLLKKYKRQDRFSESEVVIETIKRHFSF